MFKTTTLFLCFALSLVSFSCKKDKLITKTFESISLADLKANESKFASQAIPVNTYNGAGLKAGTIIFYKTNPGTYGKMKLVAITPGNVSGYDLTIDVYNFKPDGTMLLDIKGVLVHGTFLFDLDTGTESSNGADFKFSGDGFLNNSYPNSIIPYEPFGGFWVYVAK